MKKYIILYKGCDYNDEIYSIGGDDSRVEKIGFDNVDDAKSALKDKYKDIFRKRDGYRGADYSYSVGEFSYDGDEAAWQLIDDGLFGDRFKEDKYGYRMGPHYHQLIDECEKQGINWIPYVPQLLEVIEVEF